MVEHEVPFPRGRTPRAILRRAAFLVPAVVHHKWLVFLEGRRHGASWRSRLLHDADKFRPGYLWRWIVRDEVEHCDRVHRTRAPHHWEWWRGLSATSGKAPACRPMSDEARRELMSDWCARQRARGGGPTEYDRRALATYEARRDGLHFHSNPPPPLGHPDPDMGRRRIYARHRTDPSVTTVHARHTHERRQ